MSVLCGATNVKSNFSPRDDSLVKSNVKRFIQSDRAAGRRASSAPPLALLRATAQFFPTIAKKEKVAPACCYQELVSFYVPSNLVSDMIQKRSTKTASDEEMAVAQKFPMKKTYECCAALVVQLPCLTLLQELVADQSRAHLYEDCVKAVTTIINKEGGDVWKITEQSLIATWIVRKDPATATATTYDAKQVSCKKKSTILTPTYY